MLTKSLQRNYKKASKLYVEDTSKENCAQLLKQIGQNYLKASYALNSGDLPTCVDYIAKSSIDIHLIEGQGFIQLFNAIVPKQPKEHISFTLEFSLSPTPEELITQLSKCIHANKGQRQSNEFEKQCRTGIKGIASGGAKRLKIICTAQQYIDIGVNEKARPTKTKSI